MTTATKTELPRQTLPFHRALAPLGAHRSHTGPSQPSGTGPLSHVASKQSSVVQWQWRGVVRGRGGRHCPPRTSPHSFEEQPSLIINRHTKRWAPKQYGTDLFMGTSAGRFWATHRRSPLLFRYLHVSERRAGWEEGSGRRPQRICSTFPFSPFCKTGQF